MRLLAPFGTPRAIVNRLNAEWIKLAASSDAKDILGKAGFELLASTPEAFAAYHGSEIKRWGEILRSANIAAIEN